jgi:Fe-S oxidoreductase
MSVAAHVFGGAPAAARWGSRFAPLSNAIANTRMARWAAEKLAGIDRRRSLPQWTRHTLRRRVRDQGSGIGDPGGALLFVDTFTNHVDPEIGLAAIDVLNTAGIATGVAPNVCCGRPLISQGRLSDARRLAAANVHALYDAAHRGHAIVFVEPSCLSAVREDAPDLLRGELQKRARVVAQHAVLFEEFLEAECAENRATLALKPVPGEVLLHPHCHQRSMGLAPAAKALLSRIPSAKVVDLDAGCCGMAGSFGYTSEHYDVSRAIAERKLLPAARAMTAGAVLVAAGTSCRHQVADLAGVTAVHPAVLLRSLLHPLEETR